MSHCDGGNQVQQASQDNTTVQAVGSPAPHDGGAAVGLPPPATTRTSTANGGAPPSTPSVASSPPPSGVTQVQVGCLEHCYGRTTLNHSGLTLAQIEQLLGQLDLPSPPQVAAAPGSEQHTTQQTAAQSENGEGNQSQAASQTTRTVQVVATQAGAPTDGATGAAAVNQTGQGVAQLQVGCLFYCSGTHQTQQAQQSNATVQSVDGSGGGAVNTVSRVVWQVQVGCLVWCHDAVETQTAGGTDSTVVAGAPPPEVPPVDVPPADVPPGGAPVGGGAPLRPGARTRYSGGASLRVTQIAAESVSSESEDGTALVSVATSQTIETALTHRAVHRAHHRDRRRSAHGPRPTGEITMTGAGPRVVALASTTRPDLDLLVALVLAALAVGAWRRREVR